MSGGLKKIEDKSAFNKIQRFLTEGDVLLTADEELILHRWNYCYKLWIQKKFTEAKIAEKVAAAFGVSAFTGRNDIYKAQALFGGSIQSNKKFLLHHHAENILLTIEKYKNDKSLVNLVPKLMDAYTKAVMAMPDEINHDKLPPPIINFNLKAGDQIVQNLTYEEALKAADKLLADDIDFEMMPDEPKQ